MFDGTETLRPDPVVVLEGSSIVLLGFGTAVPTGTDMVDLGEATLLPGFGRRPRAPGVRHERGPVTTLGGSSDDEVLAAMREAGRTALAVG